MADYKDRWTTVDVAIDDGVAWVTLNRPEKRNAMSPTLNREMIDVLETLELDGDAEVVVLTGAGEKEEYAKVRTQYEGHQREKEYVPLSEARQKKFAIDWAAEPPKTPKSTGVFTYRNYPLEKLVPYIDWTPFFMAWELAGKYPAILTDMVVGTEASRLHGDALKMLDRIVKEQWLQANGVAAIWPANTVGDDDIELYGDASRSKVVGRFRTVRQQAKKAPGVPYIALSDFIAPKGTPDFIGGFAVTTGHGVDERVKNFESKHDDYSAILLKALADRLAEAFAEKLHQVVRMELWGYAHHEHLTNEQLIKEEYDGIRPAPGYPACPDHTEKPELFRLLEAEKHTGISLTESLAMYPTAAVSGLYFAHLVPSTSGWDASPMTRSSIWPNARARKSDGWSAGSAAIWGTNLSPGPFVSRGRQVKIHQKAGFKAWERFYDIEWETRWRIF